MPTPRPRCSRLPGGAASPGRPQAAEPVTAAGPPERGPAFRRGMGKPGHRLGHDSAARVGQRGEACPAGAAPWGGLGRPPRASRVGPLLTWLQGRRETAWRGANPFRTHAGQRPWQNQPPGATGGQGAAEGQRRAAVSPASHPAICPGQTAWRPEACAPAAIRLTHSRAAVSGGGWLQRHGWGAEGPPYI